MSSPAVVIKNLLEAVLPTPVGSFGASTGWAIAVGAEPDGQNIPDTMITIYDTGGADPNPAWLIDNPTIQVRVRGAKNEYTAAYAKCVEIKNALLGLPSQDIGTDRWVSLSMFGHITAIGKDENNRHRFTLNFRAIVEPDSGTYRLSA